MYTTTTVKEGKAALYLRVSDKKKQDVGRQKLAIANWLKLYPDIQLTRKYEEKDTARGGYVREKMNKLMADAAANQFTIAIFWEVDRLGRNVLEALQRIKMLHGSGVKVYIADVNQWYDYNDHVAVMMLNQMLVFAEFEHGLNSKRTKEGNEGKNDKISRRIKKGDLPEGTRMGQPSIVEQWIVDPDQKGTKKGLLVAPDPKKEAFFRAVWEDEKVVGAYEIIEEVLRVPVNPKCEYKCDGKSAKAPHAKCNCNNKPSNKTVHKTRVKLGLEARCKHSYKRADVPVETHDDIIASLLGDAEA